MSEVLGSAWWLLVTLGLLVTFHEFGHFVVARRCGVRVLRFSVGFGKALWSRRDRTGTEYVVAAIPLGGYVKMLDEREGDVAEEDLANAYNRKPVLQRMAISAAGPAFNLIFAVAALWVMFVVGKPDFQPIIAKPTGLAAAAGFEAGDRIVKVGGQPVGTWTDAFNAIGQASLSGAPLPVTVDPASGAETVRTLPLERLTDRNDVRASIAEIGLALKAPEVPAVAGSVSAGDPAAAAGVEAGDRIVAVNGVPIADFESLADVIQKQAAESPRLKLTLERAGGRLDVDVTAREQAAAEGQPERWIIGIRPRLPDHDAVFRLGPVAAVPAAFAQAWYQTRDMLTMIGQMLTGHVSSKNISGILTIGQVANAEAQRGFAWFLNFLAIVSLSLAVMNLLPIPILDGGHLLYYLIELVKGSPVSERAQLAGQYVGMILIVSLMGLALYNDILRIAS